MVKNPSILDTLALVYILALYFSVSIGLFIYGVTELIKGKDDDQ